MRSMRGDEMNQLDEQQEALLEQIVSAFRHGVGGEEGPSWEEFEKEQQERSELR